MTRKMTPNERRQLRRLVVRARAAAGRLGNANAALRSELWREADDLAALLEQTKRKELPP